MPTYKDVDEIRKEILQGKKNLHFKNAENAEICAGVLAFVEGVIDRVPEADVEPVKHGYIVIKPRVIGGFVNHKCPNPQCKHEWQTDERVKTLEVLCSECGKVLAHNYQSYCQYCGAKMDGERNMNNGEL